MTESTTHNKNIFPFSIEEKVNSITHAIGVLFALVGIPLLIQSTFVYAIEYLISVSIYGFCFFMTFSLSTLYHWYTLPRSKSLFKLLDRISIYFFIAGSYTPFIIFYMFDQLGIMLLSLMWFLVVIGILLELFLVKRLLFLSVIFYLVMGWMFILVSRRFFELMPRQVIDLILAGVFLYSFGVVFYIWKKWKYHHAIWHLLVLAASICHYIAIWITVSKHFA